MALVFTGSVEQPVENYIRRNGNSSFPLVFVQEVLRLSSNRTGREVRDVLSLDHPPSLSKTLPLKNQTNLMANKSRSSASKSRSNESIEIPRISKPAAGAATGAVLGAVGGPVGAVVGGVMGAVIGERAESDKPMMPAVKRLARQTASGVKVVAKTARAAVPAARRLVKSVRPGKATRPAAKKSAATRSRPAKARRAKTSSRATKAGKRQERAKR